MDAGGSTETIGERLARLRLERGLSQRALAAPGVTYAYISRIERGERAPSMKALRALAQKLGVTVQYLETGRDLLDDEARELRLADAELALRLDGDIAGAEATMREVLEDALEHGDARDAAQARIGLALAAAHHGDHPAAVALLEEVLGETWVTPRTHPNVFATLSHSYVCTDRGERAVALLERALAELVRSTPVEGPAVARFATYLSYARSDVGDLDGAREAIETALRYATSADDSYTRARLYWSNARLAALSGDYDVARSSISRAIALLETTEDTAHLGRAHVLAAEIAIDDGDLERAREHLASAETFIGPGSERQDRAWLLVQQALVDARSGNAPAAIDEATAAVELLADDGDVTLRGCGQWALGEALAVVGATSAARAAFAQASDLIAPGSKYAHRFVSAWMRLFPADAEAGVS